MATIAEPLKSRPVSRKRLFELLEAELAPHPGMYSMLLRLVVTVVITFLLVATFRMPYAAITLYSIFTIDRSSPQAAILRACESIVAITLGVAMALLGVMLFADYPPFTFAYYAVELFIAAFLIRTTRLPGPSMNMSLAIYSVHNAWERPYPPGPHLEQTLWVWLTLCLGFLVSALFEWAFARQDPVAEIQKELTGRMRALSAFYNACATRSPYADASRKAVLSYASVGTSTVRQRINSLRTSSTPVRIGVPTLAAFTALVARLVDVSATIECTGVLSESDRNRLRVLAGELELIRAGFEFSTIPPRVDFQPPLTSSDTVPALPELERTVALIPTASQASHMEGGEDLLEPEGESGIFLPDALTNTGYRLFALKTAFAAILCYVIYSALNWPGISTSVVTCMVTALNTTGATKQKQLLRLMGATVGGLLALGSIVFVLPELDSVTGVTILIALVSAFSGWFALASQRLSYFGLQTALAFYLALIQDYSATTQLAPARDRAVGVLLGLAMMWLVFDHLWPVSAAEHMRAGLARNLRYLADLVLALDLEDRGSAIRRIRLLRESLQRGFAAVHGHGDSILFEVGAPNRRQRLLLRDSILRIQATLRTLFLVEIAICQYRTQVVQGTRPLTVREAQKNFDEAVASRLRQLAQAVEERRSFPKDPLVGNVFERFASAVTAWCQTLDDRWLLTRATGVRALSKEAANLVDSLSHDALPG